jgi:hypothetical protein
MSSVTGPIETWDDPLFAPAQPDGKLITAANDSFLAFQAGVDPLYGRAVGARDQVVQSSGWRDLHSSDVNALWPRYGPYQPLNNRNALALAVTSSAPDDVLAAQTPGHPGELTTTDPLLPVWQNVATYFTQAKASLLAWVNGWIVGIPAGAPPEPPDSGRRP